MLPKLIRDLVHQDLADELLDLRDVALLRPSSATSRKPLPSRHFGSCSTSPVLSHQLLPQRVDLLFRVLRDGRSGSRLIGLRRGVPMLLGVGSWLEAFEGLGEGDNRVPHSIDKVSYR